MSHSLEYLKSKEWSMGNGKCPECCGVNEGWHGHPCYMDAKSIGHEKNCSLAKAINELGVNTLYLGEYKSDKQFEHYIDNNGVFGTRIKTENGCERYKKYAKQFDDNLFQGLTDSLLKRYESYLKKYTE